jgi:NADH:ubiquinone oxidoreductase subunit E
MKKVKVTVCLGTACYLFGGQDILKHLKNLKAKYGPVMEYEGVPCLGQCAKGKQTKAPFVRVNNIIVEQATIEAVDAAIASILESAPAV